MLYRIFPYLSVFRVPTGKRGPRIGKQPQLPAFRHKGYTSACVFSACSHHLHLVCIAVYSNDMVIYGGCQHQVMFPYAAPPYAPFPLYHPDKPLIVPGYSVRPVPGRIVFDNGRIPERHQEQISANIPGSCKSPRLFYVPFQPSERVCGPGIRSFV